MSLQTYQNAWLALMLRPQDKDTVLEQFDLSEAEKTALHTLEPERLQAIASGIQQGRMSVLMASLPASLQQLLTYELRKALTTRYAERFPQAVVYPPEQGMGSWLQWLAEQPEIAEQPLLGDLIAYEQLLLQLHFYQRPQPNPLPYPRLVPWAGLLVASPSLANLLKALQQQQDLPEPEAGQQGWLVLKHPHRPAWLQPLHWSIYHLFQQMNGLLNWAEAVQALVKQFPELQAQETALNEWQNWALTQHLLDVY